MLRVVFVGATGVGPKVKISQVSALELIHHSLQQLLSTAFLITDEER
jgi:hypothetical protein